MFEMKCSLLSNLGMLSRLLSKETILGFVVLFLVVGSFILALKDSSTRVMYADLTKVVVGTYIGIHIPSPRLK